MKPRDDDVKDTAISIQCGKLDLWSREGWKHRVLLGLSHRWSQVFAPNGCSSVGE